MTQGIPARVQQKLNEQSGTRSLNNAGRVQAPLQDVQSLQRAVIQAGNAIEDLTIALTEARARIKQLESGGRKRLTEPVLKNSWVNFGAGYKDVEIFKTEEGVVHLTGLVKDGTTTTSTQIVEIPDEYMPTDRLIFSQEGSSGVVRVDVYNNGAYFYLAATAGTWVSLAGMSWYAG